MRALLCLLVLALAVPARGADSDWRLLQAQHYVVLSQLDDRETLAWARDYDQFIASIATMLNISPKRLQPLTVILFERDKDFAQYRPERPDGRIASGVAGLFIRRPSFSLIAMDTQGEMTETRRTIYHEATHWLLSVDPRRQPAWFNEGFAELFATFERKIDKVNWGKPIGEHLGTLNYGAIIPFQEFLTQRSSLYDSDLRTGKFYAQSWAFTHMLLMSNDPAKRAKLLEYARAYSRTTTEMAVKEVFGEDLAPWEQELREYANRRSFSYMSQPVQPVPPPPAPTDAPPAQVEAALGLLALGTDKMDLARQHARRGLERDPKQPKVHALLANIAMQDEDPVAMGQHAQQAVQLGSTDPLMFLLVGDSYASGPNSQLKDAATRRVHAYENALNLDPLNLAAYERLMTALDEVEEPTAEDAKFLALGLKAFPDDDWLKVGNARLAARQGRRAEAAALMDSALRDGSSLDGSQRNFALQLRQHWELEQLHQQLSLAYEQINSGKKAEARIVLDQLLARQDLPPEMKQQAQKLRAAL